MSLFVVRHTQTDWNKEHKAQGKVNIGLNKTGIQEAEELAKKIEDYDIDLIISSPLKRATQTAQIINRNKNIPIIYDDRISERDFGEFEGQKPEVYISKGFWDYNKNVKYEKAESIKPFFRRIYGFLNQVEKRKAKKNILLVTHGAVSIAIEAYYNGIQEDKSLAKLALKHGEIKEYKKRLIGKRISTELATRVSSSATKITPSVTKVNPSTIIISHSPTRVTPLAKRLSTSERRVSSNGEVVR